LLLLSHTVERLDRHDHIEATFHWVAIPTSATLPQNIENFNDQEVIRTLTEIGAQMGANPANWRGSELSAEWLPAEVDALDPHSKGTPRAYCPARSS
jgi:hypothetical protein